MSFTRRPGVFSASDYAAITPSDSTNLTKGPCAAIWVGGAGTVQVVRDDDTVVAFECVAGTLLPVMAKRVNFTNTDATLLVALY
jgi:hypothetical protein